MDPNTITKTGKVGGAASGAERAKKFRSKNPGKVKLENLRLSVSIAQKRLTDDNFNDKFKEAVRKRKQKSRAEKKNKAGLEAESSSAERSSSTPPAITSVSGASSSSASSGRIATPHATETPTSTTSRAILNLFNKSRQGVAGAKIRKKNITEKKDIITTLENQIDQQKKELEKNDSYNFDLQLQVTELETKVKKRDEIVENLKSQLDTCDSWLKMTYKKLGPVGKKEFRTAFNLSIPDMPRGTVSRLRVSTGINFSNGLNVERNGTTELKQDVELFAIENSCEVPDMRKEKKKIRYYYNYLICLHASFLQENPSKEISYAVFCSYWPKNVIKPKIEDFGSCRCETCENIELKLSALKRFELISSSHDIQAILHDIRNDDFELEVKLLADLAALKEDSKAKVKVSYLQWEKVEKQNLNNNTGDKKKKIMNRVPKVAEASTLTDLTKIDFEKVKVHLNRNFVLKDTIKKKRVEVSNNERMAMLQVDWAENGEVVVPGEVQSAFYGGRLNYNLHTGYQYSKENSGGFVSLSDYNNHKAEGETSKLKTIIL